MRIKKVSDIINENTITKSSDVIKDSSVPVTNNRNILKWICDNGSESYREGKKNLMQNLIRELTTLFGSPNKLLTIEFKHRIWVLEYGDLKFNVYTAENKGTSIEICDYSYEDMHNGVKEREIIEFLQKLYELINEEV